MATCTIRSVFSTSQNVKVDDYVPEAGNSTNSKFVAILNEGQTFNPEPQYIKNLKAQNISFLEKNTGDLNNFNTIFPNGYTIMSTEMKYSKWISYRLTNRYSYSYKLNTTMLLLLSQTLSTLPFDLSCQICNSDDTLFQTVTLPSLSIGTAYIYATINETIPTGKYIQFRMRCPPPPAGETASSPMLFQTLLNYLVISHTGTKVAVPEMTYDMTSITSTYEKVAEKPIKLYLKPSLKGDDLAGHKVQFYANLNSQRTNLGEETIGEINAGKYSVTRNLPNGTLPVGAYTISVELKRPATSPTNYVQNASTTVNALVYTVSKQKIVLTTTVVSQKVSYLGNFIINSSIDYKKLGAVSVKITATGYEPHNDFMALLQNGDYSYTKPVKTSPMNMTIGTTYTVETQFIPDSSVASNFESSDVKTVTFTIDPYKMVISVINNLTTIKYRESIEFDAIPKTGNDSAESQVTGEKSIVISKNGVEVETQSVPYTLTPYQTSLYSPGTYVAVAKFSNASAVLDSDAYTFTIEAQNTTLAVNTEPSRTIYGDANTSDDDIKTVEGVFTYAYNTPFTVSGVLKTGTVSQLANIQGGTTNFQLTRYTDSVDVSSRISNVTMVNGEDADGPTVVYTLNVSSPADIGAGLDTDTPVDFTLKWNPPNANYLLSTVPIKVKALKDFVELKIEAAQTSVKFEDNIVITCTVSNQEQDMTMPHPDLSGTYKLYRKKLSDTNWPPEPILTQVDDSNTKTSVFTVPALELEIGTHMFYVDYVPSNQLSANFYPEIRAPANISIDVQKIDINFAVKMIDIIGNEIKSVDVDQRVRFRVTDCKTQFGDGHAVEGTLSLISPAVTGFSTVAFVNNGDTNGNFGDFKIMELLIPKTTTSFVFKFTPTRSSHFNTKEITLDTTVNPAGALPFIGSGTDLANGSPTYLEDIVINLQITLASSLRGIGNNIPLSGKLELIKTDNSVESVIYNNDNKIVTMNNYNLDINTGKKPYDFGFTYNIPVSLKLRFTPTNDEYKYYSKYEKTVTIVSQKQTLQKINIITTKPTYTYGEKIGLSVNTGDSYPFTGKIEYYLQKVVNGSGVGDMSHIGDSDIVNASSTAVKEFVITHLEAGDANNASTPYQVTCKFVSNDVNFTDSVDNITQVVPQPIAHAKSTVKLTNLKFKYKNKNNDDVEEKNLETIYNNNIELLNSSTLTITGDISNSVSTDTRLVGNGTVKVINRYTQEDNVTVSTTVYASAPVSNGTFTISYVPNITGEILLIYESTQNFLSNTNNLSQSDEFNTFYLILSNIPYDIEMSIGATVGVGITDYHDGSFTANVNMKKLRSVAATTVSGYQDKFLLTISNTNDAIVYSTKLDLVEEKSNTVGSFTFIPRKLSSTVPCVATTTLTKGLEAGDYFLKVSYDGIAGFYDAEQANDSLIPANKFIKFTVEKTNPAIKSALTHSFNGNNNTLMAETKLDDGPVSGYLMDQATDDTASFFYRELPNMSIRVQTNRTTFTPTSNPDNDLLGKTVVKFHHRSFPELSTKGYKIVNISGATGASGVSDNEITNIVDTKIVQLPLLDAGSVRFIELEFTPNDTRNYNSKNVLIRTEVKKYTPILLNAPNTDDYEIKVVPDKDGARSSNVLEPLEYKTNGEINYDENFEVHNKLQRKDPLTDIPYDNIDGELLFRYYSTAPNVKTSIDDTIPVVIDNNKLDYKTTFNPMIVFNERINIGISQTMIVSFKPADLNNYNESEPISRNFSIYVANSVGTVEIKDPVPGVVVFNKQQALTLTSTVTFGPNVDPKTGKLSFYWGNETDLSPVFTEERLLSISKNDTSTGALEVSGLSADYSLAINTTDSNNVMLTPRYDPYVILAKLTPTSNNYPVVIQRVTKTVQINPSLVITISSTKGKTSVSGPNTLSYIEVGDAKDDIVLKATLVHHNEAYSGGVANFIITKNDNGIISTYVAGVPFTNNVAEFSTKTVDYVQNLLQNGANVSQFTMGYGEYVVQCQATFGDSNPMYKPTSQDYLNGYLINNRTSTYSLSIDKTNIVYGNIRPKVTTTFDEDFVYGGYFTYTIIYTSVNGITTITQVQNLTNDADKFGSNPPSQTYTLELSSLVDSSSNIIDLTVGSYSITSTYSSPPNFSGSSNNTVYFVVNKKDVVINPLNNYYFSSNTSQFTLSATLTNPDITDSSVKFVNTTTNQVYSATYYDAGVLTGSNGDIMDFGVYSVTVDCTDLLAGTYEIMAYFSGNFNYNKSNNVFSNLIVQRQQKAITLSVSPTVNASNEYILDVNTVTGDTVHVYSTHKKEAIAVLSHTADHLYKIADTLLNVGLNRVFVTVVHPNYSGSSSIVDITRPKMPLTVSSFASSASTVPYKGTVTLTANVTVTGRGYTVTEGETMDFYVNDSHAGTVDVASNIASLPNVCLREMGANVIVAKFVNSKSYVSENTHSSITVTVTKADMAVTLYDETSSDMNKLNNKTVSLYLGTLTPTNKTNTTDDVVEFSRINSGTATFYNNNDIIYDDVPVINGVASISLSMDLASYSIKARFNGNDNYKPKDSNIETNLITFTTTQKAISDYYASVTLAEGSKNDGKTCYIIANVALKSGVASMPASSLLLNTGVVTFTFEGVSKIVNLVDGVATANFKSSSKNTLPTVVYSNTAYSGTLSPSSTAWPVDPFTVEYNEFSTSWIAPGNQYITSYFYNPFESSQRTHYTFNSSKLLFIKASVAISIKFFNNINAKIVDNIQSPGSNNPTPYVSGTVINVPGNKTIMIQITSNKQYISFQIIRNYVYEIDGNISVTDEGKFNNPSGYYSPDRPSYNDQARAIYFDNTTNNNSFGFNILANI